MTIADRRADKTTDRVRTEQERKLTRLQRNKDKRRPKTDDNWVRNISSRPLDKTETYVLSYRLKHSVTPKRIPTETIVSSVEAVLSRQRDLSESAKDNIRSRIASTVQSASIPDNNLTKGRTTSTETTEKTTTTLLYYQPTKDVLLLLWTRLITLTKWTHLLTTNKLTKNLNATRRQHFNATIDYGAQYHNHRNFTDYRNCTSLVYRCDL